MRMFFIFYPPLDPVTQMALKFVHNVSPRPSTTTSRTFFHIRPKTFRFEERIRKVRDRLTSAISILVTSASPCLYTASSANVGDEAESVEGGAEGPEATPPEYDSVSSSESWSLLIFPS